MTVPALAKKVADMESDIKTTIEIFSAVLTEFGIDLSTIDSNAEISSVLPGLLSKLTMKMAMGNFNPRTLENISAISPVFAKYKYLTEETQEND